MIACRAAPQVIIADPTKGPLALPLDLDLSKPWDQVLRALWPDVATLQWWQRLGLHHPLLFVNLVFFLNVDVLFWVISRLQQSTWVSEGSGAAAAPVDTIVVRKLSSDTCPALPCHAMLPVRTAHRPLLVSGSELSLGGGGAQCACTAHSRGSPARCPASPQDRGARADPTLLPAAPAGPHRPLARHHRARHPAPVVRAPHAQLLPQASGATHAYCLPWRGGGPLPDASAGAWLAPLEAAPRHVHLLSLRAPWGPDAKGSAWRLPPAAQGGLAVWRARGPAIRRHGAPVRQALVVAQLLPRLPLAARESSVAPPPRCSLGMRCSRVLGRAPHASTAPAAPRRVTRPSLLHRVDGCTPDAVCAPTVHRPPGGCVRAGHAGGPVAALLPRAHERRALAAARHGRHRPRPGRCVTPTCCPARSLAHPQLSRTEGNLSCQWLQGVMTAAHVRGC